MRDSEPSSPAARPGRILITGANGFLGAHLAEHLASRGHGLVLAARSPDSCWRGYIPALPAAADIRWVFVGDMGADTQWAPALRGVDAVVHLAGRAHVRHQTDEASLHRRITVDASVGLTRAASASGVRRFFYVSSIGAVTNATNLLLRADTPPAPGTVYGRAKLEAEQAVTRESQRCAMETTTIRPPLLYGPGHPGNMERLFDLVRRGWPLPLGAVRNRRSFLYVRNFTDLVFHLLGSARLPRVVVPADREHWSTPGLVGAIAAGYGVPARLVPVPEALLRLAMRLRPLQGLAPLVDSLAVDVESLTRDTGWTAPHPGAEALAITARQSNRPAGPVRIIAAI